MSRLVDAVARSQQIAIAATEEAYRAGHAEIDVDDLLVALAGLGGAAGDVLRSLGVTVAAARTAVARVHADRLGALGLPALSTEAREIPRRGGALPWSTRAHGALSQGQKEVRTDDLLILRSLVREPSGFVAEALAQLGVDTGDVDAAIAAWSPPGDAPQVPLYAPDPRRWRTVSRDGWVPAPRDDVWALVTDPARRTEWDTWYDTVEELPDGRHVATLAARDGNEGRRPARHVLVPVACEEVRLVEWELRFLDADRPAPLQRLAVALTPAAGGTRVDLTMRWLPVGGWRTAVGAVVRPVTRLLYGQMLLRKNAAIARALR